VTGKWVTPDRRVVDVITIRYPGSGAKAGPQFRIRDIHGHHLGSAFTVPELEEKLGTTLDQLEEI
jgi:hypothetical protein